MSTPKQSLPFSLALCLALLAGTPSLAQQPSTTAPAPAAPAPGTVTHDAPLEGTLGDGKAHPKQQVNIHIDPELSKKDGLYTEEVKKLNPEQQAKLKELEGDYYKTFELDMQMIKTATEVKYCAKQPDTEIAKNFGKYKSEFGVYGNKIQSELMTERRAHHDRLAKEAPFIDQQLLTAHYAFTTGVTVQLAMQMTNLSLQQGGFAKTDCAKTAALIDNTFQSSSSASTAPPAGQQEKLKQIEDAANRGDQDATVTLGMLMIAGEGVAKDTAKGLELLNKAAESGYERAEYMLGLVLGTDAMGLTPDKEKAKYWLGKAAAQGNQKAADLLKVIDNQKPPESTDALRKKAEDGDANAAYDLGSRYAFGLGGEKKDPAEALKWTLMAAGRGQPLAQSNVAVMLINGGKPEEGMVWMTKAAQNGVVNSQYELALAYMEGKLVPKDTAKAAEWAKKAADKGDSRAKQLLKELDGK